MRRLDERIAESLHTAARDSRAVAGYTHNYYRYPARFSPLFASTVIAEFSSPGDVVLDPFVGGGTTLVEAALAQRVAIGSDINSLATFVSRVKTTPLVLDETAAVRAWLPVAINASGYRHPREGIAEYMPGPETKNLSGPRARAIKKAMAAILSTSAMLPTDASQNFARCALLQTGQWALDGRRIAPGVEDFRSKFVSVVDQMLAGMEAYGLALDPDVPQPVVLDEDVRGLERAQPFGSGRKARLVLTSPPYTGVHVLYHRWQVDGRRETGAPYWLAGCADGQAASFYTFGSRTRTGEHRYFDSVGRAFRSIHAVCEYGAHVVQLVAFSEPDRQLGRYLDVMDAAGFDECMTDVPSREWRCVPNRKWYAMQKGQTPASREAVLVHSAR